MFGIEALVGGGEKNRGTVITTLQLAFTERFVPATQAFDWSLDKMLICVDNSFSLSCRHWLPPKPPLPK